jgi:hypothetical protein
MRSFAIQAYIKKRSNYMHQSSKPAENGAGAAAFTGLHHSAGVVTQRLFSGSQKLSALDEADHYQTP